jgi:ArsR family transcriptional regulator
MARDAPFYEVKARTVAAMAHPVRLQILDELARGELGAGELVELLGLPQPLISQHLAVLRGAGVVVCRRAGSHQIYRLAAPSIARACRLMNRIVRDLLDSEQRRLQVLARSA